MVFEPAKCRVRGDAARVVDGGAARMLPQMPSSRLPELIAHRGNVAEYPENTLPALRSALELGARHLGFDVQLSVDRHPVLLNDSNLQRIAGVDRNALEMTWERAGGVRTSERSRDTDIGIPRLGQAVDLLASHADDDGVRRAQAREPARLRPRGCGAQGVRSAQAGRAPVRARVGGLRSRASRAAGFAVSHRLAPDRVHEHRRAEVRGARARLSVLRSPAADARAPRSCGAARGAGSSTTCGRRSWRSSSQRAARAWSRPARFAT